MITKRLDFSKTLVECLISYYGNENFLLKSVFKLRNIITVIKLFKGNSESEIKMSITLLMQRVLPSNYIIYRLILQNWLSLEIASKSP